MKYLKKKPKRKGPKAGYAVPFFLAMAVLTVVAFIIPLRPTQSYTEKRNLAQFPAFSGEALLSGDYFDDINTWFSDTFPGRESWLKLNNTISSLHGSAEVAVDGDFQVSADPIPVVPKPTRPPVEETELPTEQTQLPTEATQAPTEVTQAPTETVPVETTVPPTEEIIDVAPPTEPVEQWGGVDAGEGAEVYLSKAIQIGDSAFTYFGFSEYYSNKYIKLINKFHDAVKDKGVNVIQASAPTAVGILVENEYMEKLKCSPQDQVVDYINGSLNEGVYGIDTYESLIDHNDEYLFFRTDHHWTALAAYYVYVDVCEALGNIPAELSDFEVWDQGKFEGSLYYKCKYTSKLLSDNVIAYNPPGELSTRILKEDGKSFQWEVLTDMSRSNVGSKYMTFLAGDHPLVTIQNDSLPDAPNCVLIKDSFGNCFAPFLTQNYHTVYVVDYRTYRKMGMRSFVDQYDIQDVILMPNLAASQTENVIALLEYILR